MTRLKKAIALILVIGGMLACMPVSWLEPGETPRVTIIPRDAGSLPTRQPLPTLPPLPALEPLPTLPPLSDETIGYVQARDLTLSDLYQRWSGSIVHILVSNNRGESGSGSGWVWDANGYLVTNHHVIDGATAVQVLFPDESQYEARIIGSDADSDLAVLLIQATNKPLVPLQLGDSSQVRVGQTTVAIGNPFGFAGTMTSGIVSAVGRVTTQASGYSLPSLIQTDASINPGNSGGPLFDISGHVIGVNTMIYSRTGEFSGIGFAVPSNTVARVVPELIATGRYQHPYLGVRGWTITESLSAAADLPVRRGALIAEVTPGGPAADAGLRGGTRTVRLPGYAGEGVVLGGDIIVALDGFAVEGMNDLVTRLEAYRVGDTVTLTVVRDGNAIEVPAQLGARPAQSGRTFGAD